MILAGDYVRILNGFYRGENGIVINFDGYRYKIKLLKKELEVKIERKDLEKISKNQIEEKIIKIRFDDGSEEILKDQDLRYTCDCLKYNRCFKGLYALGKYYSKEQYPKKHKKDYFTQQILKIKNFYRTQAQEAAQEIAKIYIFLIDQSELLKNIIKNINYICFMPNINYKNHVEQWGSILCDNLSIQDISHIIKIPAYKEEGLRDYKYKVARERQKIISGAFLIRENTINLKEKNCLILDDICTTGLQINELSSTLSKAGVKEVYAFVIGRTKY